jgi:hypothetical protein
MLAWHHVVAIFIHHELRDESALARACPSSFPSLVQLQAPVVLVAIAMAQVVLALVPAPALALVVLVVLIVMPGSHS